MRYTSISHSPQETYSIASKLAKLVPLGSVVLLEGRLGSGKTTFTKGFGRALGIQRAIKSPTYMIAKDYELEQGIFVHMDAYRLEDGGADTIDVQSYLTEDAIIFIEWAQFLEDYLPEDYLLIQIEPQDDTTRSVTICNVGNRKLYHGVIEQLLEWEREEK